MSGWSIERNRLGLYLGDSWVVPCVVWSTLITRSFTFSPITTFQSAPTNQHQQISAHSQLVVLEVPANPLTIAVTGDIVNHQLTHCARDISASTRHKAFIDARAYWGATPTLHITSVLNVITSESSTSRILSCIDTLGACSSGVIAYTVISTTNIYFCTLFFNEVTTSRLCSGTMVASRNIQWWCDLARERLVDFFPIQMTHAVAGTDDQAFSRRQFHPERGITSMTVQSILAGPSSNYYIEQQPQAPQKYGAEYNNNGPPIPTAISPVQQQHQHQPQYNAGPGPGMSSPAAERAPGQWGSGAGYHLNPLAQTPRGRSRPPTEYGCPSRALLRAVCYYRQSDFEPMRTHILIPWRCFQSWEQNVPRGRIRPLVSRKWNNNRRAKSKRSASSPHFRRGYQIFLLFDKTCDGGERELRLVPQPKLNSLTLLKPELMTSLEEDVNTSLTSMKFNLAFLATALAMISVVNGAIAPVVNSQTGGQKTVVSNEDLAPPRIFWSVEGNPAAF
ncbi:hypothetical protein B0H14DRAFT_2561042 [Mycena olivaceomarginata]|nr:hypothetical protein B0H14DRAFT_2561042 [Mycena olivaceomarginata]